VRRQGHQSSPAEHKRRGQRWATAQNADIVLAFKVGGEYIGTETQDGDLYIGRIKPLNQFDQMLFCPAIDNGLRDKNNFFHVKNF
jgi:hypothetical protein